MSHRVLDKLGELMTTHQQRKSSLLILTMPHDLFRMIVVYIGKLHVYIVAPT